MEKAAALRAARMELARASTAVRQAWNLYTSVEREPSSSFALVIENISVVDDLLRDGLSVDVAGDMAREPHALSCLCSTCHAARVSP